MSSAPVTLADIQAAMEAIRSAEYEPCRHVVHPSALKNDGVYICGMCGLPVPVRDRRVDWSTGSPAA